LDFAWSPDFPIQKPTTIVFDLRLLSGKGYVGKSGEATLVLEPAAKITGTVGRKGLNLSKLEQQGFGASPATAAAPRAGPEPVKPLFDLDNDAAVVDESQFDLQDMTMTQMDDEILEQMIEAFPSLEPSEIARVIREEHQAMMPLQDKNLLHDLVTMKLSNKGDGALDPEHSNIRMTKGPEEE
jgi:hypothetical protein